MKKIALTFDDGPSRYTLEILDILKSHRLKTTFFCLGKNLEKYPQIAKKINESDHIIANHGYNHHPIKSPLGLNFKEIEKTQELIQKIDPKAKKFFRPPYGILNPILKRKLEKTDYKIIMFDIVGKDWQKGITADQITKNVTSKLFDKAIIVLHDGFDHHNDGDRSQTVKALPQIIKDAKKKSYEFVSIDKLEG